VHCGAWFEEGSAVRGSALSSSLLRFFAVLPPDAGEFGLGNPLALLVGLSLAGVMYALGWFLEDRRYWLAPGAVATWAAALPIWLGLVAFIWRTRRKAWPFGFGIALALLAIHLGIMGLIRGHFNDDMLGIAAVYAALALAGWLLGRLAHLALRRRRVDVNPG